MKVIFYRMAYRSMATVYLNKQIQLMIPEIYAII